MTSELVALMGEGYKWTTSQNNTRAENRQCNYPKQIKFVVGK